MHEIILQLPEIILAQGTHKVPDVRLGEMPVVVLHQLGVNGGHGHEDVDPRTFGV